MKKAFFLLLLIYLLSISIPAFAGGGTYTAEIIDFKYKGNNEYVMTLIQYDDPWDSSRKMEPQKLIIHLRHNDKMFAKDKGVTRESFKKGISKLTEQYNKGGKFQFGVWSNGYHEIKGSPGEYQSNGLMVITSSGIVLSVPNSP